ncbi:hypothetical protein ANCCAN_09311 [Ancylostoma caninum]|uniref:Uncharacterized protein n=1 Tax=Ancylostoma caninum TaxID=29170 RepID=A0A368GJW4_ANCCA|nr:hypothetical protein ANCCAN_09311 [Ancylostoma caninum]
MSNLGHILPEHCICCCLWAGRGPKYSILTASLHSSLHSCQLVIHDPQLSDRLELLEEPPLQLLFPR